MRDSKEIKKFNIQNFGWVKILETFLSIIWLLGGILLFSLKNYRLLTVLLTVGISIFIFIIILKNIDIKNKNYRLAFLSLIFIYLLLVSILSGLLTFGVIGFGDNEDLKPSFLNYEHQPEIEPLFGTNNIYSFNWFIESSSEETIRLDYYVKAHTLGVRNKPIFKTNTDEKKLILGENKIINTINYSKADLGTYSYCVEIITIGGDKELIGCTGREQIFSN